ncbi:hypothetical protein [Streptococcus suis]|uniref:hypothetical protein n=1 Tax=Streptococcus suis TaxID=1307 RepID=UPI0005CCAC63|nr:hypothetical protein [Streptococcus suis]NQH64277.1 hypothetical protein [Streptococcus suis]CYU92775.1 Uncharacterised protein [Streptococcus suis]HEL1624593.1 hypothetical protein [Streptococcus suis]
MKTKKAYWLTLLLVAVVLFLLGLNTGVYAFNLLAIGTSFLVYRNGYDVLFREYDDSQKEKRETAEKIYAALREGKKKGE